MRAHPGIHVLLQYGCAYCSIKMSNKDDIEAHMKQVHSTFACSYKMLRDIIIGDEGPPRCIMCSEEFSLYSTLLQHVKEQHGENGVDKHTAGGVLLFDDYQVCEDIKSEEHQIESIVKLQVHPMNQHDAEKVYHALTPSESSLSKLMDSVHDSVDDDAENAVRYEIDMNKVYVTVRFVVELQCPFFNY